MFLVYALAGVFCLGLAPLFGKTVLNTVNPVTAFVLRTMIAAVIIAAWFLSAKGFNELLTVPPSLWIIITIEAVLAALLGDLAYFYALKDGNINEVSLIMSCAPLVTISLSYFLLNEVITGSQLIGAVFITIGLVLISL
ncbi:EamA family transporter [Sporomusa termitida]|uniref:EamA-like transporter family protein n=1 Tax=Sporomusa termitida TaxID=2377 RepID=A0A517DP77_9FIRM|nr:EamA family transporter [Sporomusa termitida]QDR79161.1 EamA-like transporter family protein [Sporomusa termitida]